MTDNILPFPLNFFEIGIVSPIPGKVTLRIAPNHEAAEELAAGRWMRLGFALLYVDGVALGPMLSIDAMPPPFPILQIVGPLDQSGVPVGDTDFLVHINGLQFEVTADEARRLAKQSFDGILVFEAYDPINDDY